MGKRIKVLVFSNNLMDGCSWYRAMGPLSHLAKTTDVDIDILPVNEVGLVQAQVADVAFFQRPCTAEELDFIGACRKMRVPIIVDFDDDLTCVPMDSPAHGIYMTPQVQGHLNLCAAFSDVLTVSTETLAQAWRKLLPKHRIYVVKNALDERLQYDSKPGKLNTIMWRGTASHQKDILLYRDQFLRFYEKNPGAHMTFFGFNPWYVTEAIRSDQYLHRPTVLNVPDFLITLRDLGPKLGMVPLVDNPFNRAKSNIALLELTWAGAVTLVPDWAEWKQPGALTYSDPDSFLTQLDDLIRFSIDDLEEHHAKAWANIQENFMLRKWNKIREAIILAAMNRGEWPEGAHPLQAEATA